MSFNIRISYTDMVVLKMGIVFVAFHLVFFLFFTVYQTYYTRVPCL